MANLSRREYDAVEWCRRSLSDETKGQAILYELWHLNAENGSELKKIDHCRPGTIDENGIVERFFGRAEIYSKELNGQQLFQIKTYYGENDREPGDYYNFRCTGKLFDGLVPSEEASAKGATAQTMRHLEANGGLNYKLAGLWVEGISKERERDASIIDKMLVERDKQYERLIDLTLKLADGQHAHKMAEIQLKHKLEQERQLMQLVPAAINHATDTEVFPQATGDSLIIDQIAEALDPSAFNMIPNLIKDPKLAALLQARLASSLEKNRKRREQDIESIPSDAEGDAAGGVVRQLKPKGG